MGFILASGDYADNTIPTELELVGTWMFYDHIMVVSF